MKTAVRSLLFGLLLLLSTLPAAAAGPYRMELQIRPMAPFPFLKKFGEIDLTVYPAGVAAKSLFLKGYSRNGQPSITIMNPIARMYTDMPITDVRTLLLKLSGSKNEVMPGLGRFEIEKKVLVGKVRNIPAKRYRVILGPQSSIYIWTTSSIPKNPQYERIYQQFIGTISQPALALARTIPGTPIYVEMDTRRFKKLPLMELVSWAPSNEGEADALETGSFYMRAAILDMLYK